MSSRPTGVTTVVADTTATLACWYMALARLIPVVVGASLSQAIEM